MDNKNINILLIEDNPSDTVLIWEMLKESPNHEFKFHNSKRLQEGFKYLEKNDVDVLLLDLNLPDSHGLETYQKANKNAPNTPIIILTGLDDENMAVGAVKGEAQDYLIKGKVDNSLLSRSISYAIERKRIEIELKKYHGHLEELVDERTDELKKSNENLKKEIRARIKAEEEIKASLNEKKILLEEIHNRVENNFLMVSNLIWLEYAHTNKEPIEIYQESQNRVKAIALIHERLSKSEDFAVIDFSKYVEELVKYLLKSYVTDSDNINITMRINGILLDIDTAIPSGLILNELISNSLKHAFKGRTQGEINISVSLNHDNFEIMVCDNGIGLSEELDYIYTETPGLQLVNTLVRQLDGLIKLENNGGTTFKITFRDFKP